MELRTVIHVIALLVYTFGVFAFGSVTFYALRDPIRRCWGLREARRAGWRSYTPAFALTLISFVWFIVLLLRELTILVPGGFSAGVNYVFLTISLLYPPLIAHVAYSETVRHAPGPLGGVWRLPYRLMYLTNGSMVVFTLLQMFGLNVFSGTVVGWIFGFTIGGGFTLAGIYSAFIVRKVRARNEKEHRQNRTMAGLYLYMFFLALLATFVFTFDLPAVQVVQFLTTSMPLLFIFVGVWQDDRFEFFDLFIKRGLAMLLTAVILTVWFALVLPPLQTFDLSWARPWAYAVAMLPVAMSLPWLYRKLGKLLDSRYLGRNHTPVGAITRFLSRMQESTSEEELVSRAQNSLGEIFRADVRIALDADLRGDDAFAPVLRVPINSVSGVAGRLLLSRRANDVPYFSEDVKLLGSLADVFGYMLENMRLQRRRREQEQRAQELSLQASRSELKALRAQIRPHFLFNALNAIAGLIHDDPDRADETVERLAEVFRYTLRGSESEWTQLSDELEFVEAYLAVERARFGSRLSVKLDVQEAAGSVRIPTMLVQTLVENAIKHGVSPQRGPASVTVGARVVDGATLVEVRDNGPGPGAPVTAREPGGSGYGLKHVRERLQGHYGGAARLVLERDEARGETVARIELPREEARGAKDAGRVSA